MEDGFRYVIYSLFAGIIVILALVFGVRVLNTGMEYNKILIEVTHHKSSSHYKLPDNTNPILYISPEEAYTDIIGTDYTVSIQINGSDLDVNVLSKARNGDYVAIQALKNALIQSKYHKVTTYTPKGKVTIVNFIGA